MNHDRTTYDEWTQNMELKIKIYLIIISVFVLVIYLLALRTA